MIQRCWRWYEFYGHDSNGPVLLIRRQIHEKVDLKGGPRGTAAGGRRTCHSTVC